mgnify:CR=1 FL=1
MTLKRREMKEQICGGIAFLSQACGHTRGLTKLIPSATRFHQAFNAGTTAKA